MSLVDDFVAMSHAVGAPEWDAIILGEGNTSLLAENDTFYVKASGCNLSTLTAEHAVQLRRAPLMALLEKATVVSEAELQETYKLAKVDEAVKARPSVEAIFHALLLGYPNVKAVVHTHPTAVNALTCSKGWPAVLEGRICPDEAVVLGPDSVFVDYVDPGAVLAKTIRVGVDAYMAKWGAFPKAIYMQNHGVIALGASPTEALNVTQMAIKAARMRLWALQAGGIHPLSPETVLHLLGRPDEKYRQQMLAGK
jgi:rhamnose utilization protein RhaD (predicted bifunctional aldolase and dehydrogenase)